MQVVTRFAPSPTGFLHIGGARTALFNYLFAKHHHGKFLLRIEDTDRERSTQSAVDAILRGMEWLGLVSDVEPVFQFARSDRHAEVARQMLAMGQAYYCYEPMEKLTEQRLIAKQEGRFFRFESPWRESKAVPPVGAKAVIRLKAPRSGSTVIKDLVQGDVEVQNSQLDDMVLLRSDGTPTYMLAVVVDDYDMAVTHVIRGDDHLVNAARQMLIYQAMGWDIPVFAHIPLIHGPDGAKLSKRHGALGVDGYQQMGYLPEAMNNYLLRLGWSHGDAEIISQEQATSWFNLEAIGKSPARLDFAKLESVNSHYIHHKDPEQLLASVVPFIEEKLGGPLDDLSRQRISKGLAGLKSRAKTLLELAASSLFYTANYDRVKLPPEQAELVDQQFIDLLKACDQWEEEAIKEVIKNHCQATGIKLGDVAAALRLALTGAKISPSVFEIMFALGQDETLRRIESSL